MLTKEQAIENHRRLWRHIAEKTRAEKRCVYKYEAIEDIWDDIKICSQCWCCEYAFRLNSYSCTQCPVVWGDESAATVWCMGSECGEWRDTCDNDDWEKAAEMAERIANLPEREGV